MSSLPIEGEDQPALVIKEQIYLSLRKRPSFSYKRLFRSHPQSASTVFVHGFLQSCAHSLAIAGYPDTFLHFTLPSNAILELKNKKSPRGRTPRAEKFKGIIAYSGPSLPYVHLGPSCTSFPHKKGSISLCLLLPFCPWRLSFIVLLFRKVVIPSLKVT